MLKRYKTTIKLYHYSREESKEDAKKSAINYFQSMDKKYLVNYLKIAIKTKEVED